MTISYKLVCGGAGGITSRWRPHPRTRRRWLGCAGSAPSGIRAEDVGLASSLYNTPQVGGVLGLAILATLALVATRGTLVGLGREPQPTDQVRALVHGFHGARFCSAVLIAAGFCALLLLLNHRDDAAVSQRETALATGI